MSENLQLLIVGLVVALCTWRAIKRYAPNAEPESLRKDIEAALAAKAS